MTTGAIFLHPLERSGVLTELIKRNRWGIWQWADPALIGGGVASTWVKSLRAEATALDVWHGRWHFQWHFLHLHFPPTTRAELVTLTFMVAENLIEVAPLEGWIRNWREIKIRKRLSCHSKHATFFFPVKFWQTLLITIQQTEIVTRDWMNAATFLWGTDQNLSHNSLKSFARNASTNVLLHNWS